MSYERRTYPREEVNWSGHAAMTEGPLMPVRVLDVSSGGARLEIRTDVRIGRQELLELSAVRRGCWPFVSGRSVNALGRVVRVSPGRDEEHVEVAVRFNMPLRREKRQQSRPRFSLEWAGSGAGQLLPRA